MSDRGRHLKIDIGRRKQALSFLGDHALGESANSIAACHAVAGPEFRDFLPTATTTPAPSVLGTKGVGGRI
jgi:hypothetical protein